MNVLFAYYYGLDEKHRIIRSQSPFAPSKVFMYYNWFSVDHYTVDDTLTFFKL